MGFLAALDRGPTARAALEAAGQPAVAVYWIATEDHDWAEVASAVLPTPEGLRTFDLGADPQPLAPVGMRALGPGMADVLAALAAGLAVGGALGPRNLDRHALPVDRRSARDRAPPARARPPSLASRRSNRLAWTVK